ncbi:hypothetical protein Tco_1349637, partial [Tanacetum coccineum]
LFVLIETGKEVVKKTHHALKFKTERKIKIESFGELYLARSFLRRVMIATFNEEVRYFRTRTRRVVVAAMFVLGTGRCCYMFRTVPKVYRDDKICITEFGEVGDGKMLNTIAFTKAIHRIWTFEKDVLNFVASFLLMKLSGAIYEETERYVCKLREAHGIAISVDGVDSDGNDRGKECRMCCGVQRTNHEANIDERSTNEKANVVYVHRGNRWADNLTCGYTFGVSN